MNIVCTICSDLMNQAENIHVIKCGHLFHYACIKEWIDRAHTCPQCRIKVTARCLFRIYPTISNENSKEDVASLQSKLDNTQLQLREKNAELKKIEQSLKDAESALQVSKEALQKSETKLVVTSAAMGVLKQQLNCAQKQNKEMERLKEENEVLKKNLDMLKGLQKVLNECSTDVEKMLQGYDDIRTLATFATALKRALFDSEKKKNQFRDRVQALKQSLEVQKNKVAQLQQQIAEESFQEELNRKSDLERRRKEFAETFKATSPKMKEFNAKTERVLEDKDTSNNDSITRLVNKIENSDSPYLNLKQSCVPLMALQRHPKNPIVSSNLKPSELALFNSGKASKKSDLNTSIFSKKENLATSPHKPAEDMNISYDGLGGHSKLDVFPTPSLNLKSCVPKLTAKHKLKRPTSSQDIQKFLKKKKE